MAGFRLILRYMLSELRPTPQRMRRLIELFSEWGYHELYLDWSDSFPWTLDERIRSADAFGEDLVSGLVKEARGRGIVLHAVFPAPDSLDFAARVPVYRRLFRTETGRPVLDLSVRAACKFYADLFDDFVSLLPDGGSVMIDYQGPSLAPALLATAVRPFRTRGRLLVLRYTGPAERLAVDLPALYEGFDLVAAPIAKGAPLFQTHPGRLIAELPLASPTARKAAPEALRTAGYADGLPLLLSFQRERTRDAGARVGELLEESIEGMLSAVRSAATKFSMPAEPGARQPALREGRPPKPIVDRNEQSEEEHRGRVALGRRLETALDAGWRAVRAARESLRGPRQGVEAVIESIAEAYRLSRAASEDLRVALAEIVDAERLDRAVRRRLGAIYEEYLELCGRAGMSVAAAPPDPPDDGERLATDRFSC